MLFGTVVAIVNISACRVPLPNRYTNSMSRKKPRTRDNAVPDAMSMLAETSRLVCLRSSVVGPVSVLIPGGTAPPDPPGLIPGGAARPERPGPVPEELILGLDVSDIKFLGRRRAQRWQLILSSGIPA